MNRARLLKALAGHGYNADKPDIESVKKFLADNSHIALIGDDGTPVDIEKAWAAESTTEPKPKVQIVFATDEATAKELEQVKADLKKAREQAAGRKAPNGEDTTTPQRFSIGNSAKAMYNARVKSMGVGKGQHQPKFADADTAEACAALVRLAICGTHAYGQKKNDTEIVQKAQVEYDNTLGGYLVPTEFVSQLIYLTEPYGTARKVANVVRMSKEVQGHPRKTGIPTMTWGSEGGTISVSNANVDLVELVAKKLTLLMQASNELLEDSAINVSDFVATTVREAYDLAVDNAYFLGDGTSTYGGFVGLANALPTSAYYSGSGAWTALTTGDFNAVFGLLQNINSQRLAIVCSRQFYFQVCVRLDKATSQFKNLIEGSGADGAFLGYPVYFSQVLPTATASAQKSAYIGDFAGGSMIGDRRDLSIMSSEHSAFTSDSIQWRATARASINIHGDGRGSTYGPIMCLKAAT